MSTIALNLTKEQLDIISSALMHEKFDLQARVRNAPNKLAKASYQQRVHNITEVTELIYNARKVPAETATE